VLGCEPGCGSPKPTKPCFGLSAPISVVSPAKILPGDVGSDGATISGRFASVQPRANRQAVGRGRSPAHPTTSGRQRRLQRLQAKLANVEGRLDSAGVSVCRGGQRPAKLRHHLDRVDVELTRAEWLAWWQAKRWFLIADGDATKQWGNETIRVHPDEQWLELRLPTPMAALSNTPGRACTYRLACPVAFNHRRDEWAVQAASGPVRYDISYRPGRTSGSPTTRDPGHREAGGRRRGRARPVR
jgi:hypothetical protein